MPKPVLFSEREKEVIGPLLQGKSNKQIALELAIAQRTVEFHLSNIYAKLGATSRTEAALKLAETYLRESTGRELRESTVTEMDESDDNVNASISTRRSPVNKSFLIALGILIATAAFCLISLYIMVKDRSEAQDPFPSPTNPPAVTSTTSAETPTSTLSSKEHILEQARQLAAEYEQAVQAEKQNGDVEYSKDPVTGDDIFIFRGESYIRISDLRNELHSKVNGLINLYAQIYRDETNPTPFPTQLSSEQNQPYLNFLYQQGESVCSSNTVDIKDAVAVFYDPEEGKYHPFVINDETAHCYVYGWMIEDWRTGPILSKVNNDADMAMIRQVTGKRDLILKFQAIQGTANAPGRNAALYTDETGMKYYVDIETARLVEVIPNFPSHPNAPANEKKSMDELRGIATQFASTNSPRLAEMESVLLYEENCKGDICFFRWDYRNKDWAGTGWRMMPPFLQVGVLADGQIVTYNNTLDLFE